MYVPKELFLTKGVGRDKEQLTSFELALRSAGIAEYNLVQVSSIFPPQCKIISRAAGLKKMQPGQIAFAVLSKLQSNEAHRLMAASVGLAIPKDRNRYGYLAEHHQFGQTNDVAGDYAENLAASMLATILGVEFDPELSWDKKKELWRISGEIVDTRHMTQSAIGKNGLWTTVLTAAVLL